MLVWRWTLIDPSQNTSEQSPDDEACLLNPEDFEMHKVKILMSCLGLSSANAPVVFGA